MKLKNIKGYALAAFAAAAYGTNPAFAVPLYDAGMNPNTVVLFRYLFGAAMLIPLMFLRGLTFRLTKEQLAPVAVLGVLMAFSSLALFESYRYINSGIASTLLFVYPILVAILMTFVFHERFKATFGICLIIMAIGLILLMKPTDGSSISVLGIVLVMISALTYALYIILVNVSKVIKGIPTTKLMFYMLTIGSLLFVTFIPFGSPLTLPSQPTCWLNLVALGLIPTVISLACTTLAIQLIGSTPTAILGALEPVSAVALSVLVLGQTITPRDMLGAALIVIATSLVVADSSVEKVILHVRKMFPRNQNSDEKWKRMSGKS